MFGQGLDQFSIFLGAVALSSARLIGLFAFFPVFAWLNVSMTLRNAAAIALTIPVAISISKQISGNDIFNIMNFMGLVLKEFLIGLILGIATAAPATAATMAGELTDEVRGMQNPSNINFGDEEVPSVVGTYLLLAVIAIFFLGGGFHALLNGLYTSYEIWPPLQPLLNLKDGAQFLFLKLLDDVFLAGLILAIPLILPILLLQIAMAFAARGLSGFNIDGIALSFKNLVLIFVLIVYSFFIWNSVAANNARFLPIENFLSQIIKK